MSILKFWHEDSSEWYPISTAVALLNDSVSNEKLGSDIKVGSLSALNTAVKTDIASALNEVLAKIGTLSSLTTTTKTSTVAAINEVKAQANAIPVIGMASGTGTFAGDAGRTVSIGKTMANTAYRISITQTGAVDGSTGDVAVTSKTTTNFIVKNTGSSGGAFDWIVIA